MVGPCGTISGIRYPALAVLSPLFRNLLVLNVFSFSYLRVATWLCLLLQFLPHLLSFSILIDEKWLAVPNLQSLDRTRTLSCSLSLINRWFWVFWKKKFQYAVGPWENGFQLCKATYTWTFFPINIVNVFSLWFS